jgi:hypothetical protein
MSPQFVLLVDFVQHCPRTLPEGVREAGMGLMHFKALTITSKWIRSSSRRSWWVTFALALTITTTYAKGNCD